MAVNPYTLYHLYQNGILDYVPSDLMMGSPMGTMMPMNNPYLDMAKQGGLYQNHGMVTDSFQHSSYTPAYTPQYFQSASTSANSFVGANSNYNGGTSAYNVYNGGGYSQYGFNGSGINGPYSNPNGVNAFGGLTGVPSSIANGVNKTVSFVDRIPKFILGIAGGTIGALAIVSAFKRGKKPNSSGNGSGFFSKLNPMNWFKSKSKTPKSSGSSSSFWSKLNPKNWFRK